MFLRNSMRFLISARQTGSESFHFFKLGHSSPPHARSPRCNAACYVPPSYMSKWSILMSSPFLPVRNSNLYEKNHNHFWRKVWWCSALVRHSPLIMTTFIPKPALFFSSPRTLRKDVKVTVVPCKYQLTQTLRLHTHQTLIIGPHGDWGKIASKTYTWTQ